MHLTSSPFVSRPAPGVRSEPYSDDHILRTLMEADAVVRMMLLDHLCGGDETRRSRLTEMVEAALAWRSTDTGARP